MNISEYLSKVQENNRIEMDLYNKYNVKRGLRNADGTGVLVGLTRVGDVHGYIMDEGERIAVDGKLYYRGIDVEDLVKHAIAENRFGYEEAVYLLLFGDLPNKNELENFCKILGQKRALPENFAEDTIMKVPSPDIMNKLARSVLTCYAYDKRPDDLSPENVLRQCLDLIAWFPTMVAYAYMAKKHYYDHESLFIHTPAPTCSTAETLLSLIRQDQKFTRLEAEILDLALVLHAEHGGGNNSTFAVHLISSADTDTYSCHRSRRRLPQGLQAWRRKYQSNENDGRYQKGVQNWDDEGEVADYLVKILKGEAFDKTGLIYGQGHAVYTLSDPRTILLRNKAAELANEKGFTKEFNLYRTIESLVPRIFSEVKGSDKTICTNVDFYSGFVYHMLGIPSELYTPIFAISRVAGWCAHRMEEIISGGRIIRPAYKCVQPRLAFVPIAERE